MSDPVSVKDVKNINNLSEKQNIDLSVIIACFNSSRTIRNALEAISNQVTNYNFEILVVDSSKDDTPEIVANEFPHVHLFRYERQTYPGTARNLGIEKARGTYVVFTDSDCVPDSNWVEQIIKTITRVQTDAVGGCLINGYPKSLTAWVSHLIEFNEWTETTPAGIVTNIPSANLAYKKETFTRLKEYFPDYLGSEDTILNWKMQNKGVRIYFDPKIRIVHLNRVSLIKLFRHQYNLGRWSAEARRNVDLPGSYLVKYRILVFALPIIRWARALVRLLRKDIPKFLLFLFITPIYLATAVAWSIGFVSKQKLTFSIQSQENSNISSNTRS